MKEKSDNELIAEFMGLKWDSQCEAWFNKNSGSWVTTGGLNYAGSWDELMPVVEKINSGNGTINIDADSVFVHAENEILTHIYNYQSGGKIGAVYTAVLSFIKWYNSQSIRVKE